MKLQSKFINYRLDCSANVRIRFLQVSRHWTPYYFLSPSLMRCMTHFHQKQWVALAGIPRLQWNPPPGPRPTPENISYILWSTSSLKRLPGWLITKPFHPHPSVDCIAFTTCLRNTRNRVEQFVQNLICINNRQRLFISSENRQAFWLPCLLLFSGPNLYPACWRQRLTAGPVT